MCYLSLKKRKTNHLKSMKIYYYYYYLKLFSSIIILARKKGML